MNLCKCAALRGFDDLFACRIGFAQTNISIKSVMEKVWSLWYPGDGIS